MTTRDFAQVIQAKLEADPALHIEVLKEEVKALVQIVKLDNKILNKIKEKISYIISKLDSDMWLIEQLCSVYLIANGDST